MANKILMLFPIVVIAILTLVGILFQSWFFLLFNIIGIGFSWLFISMNESIPSKIADITAVSLIALSGILILCISLSIGPEIKVTGVVVDSSWSGVDDDMEDTYDLEIEYEVDNKVYHATVISNSSGTVGESHTVTVMKNNPGKQVSFSPVSGIVVGCIYIVISAVIGFFMISGTVKKHRKQLK